MVATHKIEFVSFDRHLMFLKVDGHTWTVSLEKVSSKLVNANEIQRELYKISPSGYGIHWPLIDEDLSVDFLIKLANKSA